MDSCCLCLEDISKSDGFVACPNSHKNHIRCFLNARDSFKSRGHVFKCSCAYTFLESNEMMVQLDYLWQSQRDELKMRITFLLIEIFFLRKFALIFLGSTIVLLGITLKLLLFYLTRPTSAAFRGRRLLAHFIFHPRDDLFGVVSPPACLDAPEYLQRFSRRFPDVDQVAEAHSRRALVRAKTRDKNLLNSILFH